MLGLLVIIIISWILLYFIEKKNIDVLGIVPNKKRGLQFVIGFVFIVLITLSLVYIETMINSIVWEQKSVDFRLICDAFVYHVRSALTEDLVFRGAILYILIRRLGANWGILISALCFGVYHVFSYGMTSERIVPIVYVILVTGFTGYVWAYAFDKTKSILFALGLHIGSNMILTLFFPSQNYGEILFTELSRVHLTEWNEFYFSLFKGFYASAMTFLFLRLILKSNFKIFKTPQETV
ncbi:CPBP family intramembrane glutamic endopeptidase [Lacinutrix iliipiscaria]|uniref:CPBP family intramembrane glutamic endopeptidase n=1 Tax=Lacinutrix iliipiscaria TaxID=1230532 RepID=A0ABW5WMT8_9FLAO